MYITENKLIPKNPNLLPQKDTDSLVKYLKQSPESDSLDPPGYAFTPSSGIITKSSSLSKRALTRERDFQPGVIKERLDLFGSLTSALKERNPSLKRD